MEKNDEYKWEWMYKYPTQYNLHYGQSEKGCVNTHLNLWLVMAKNESGYINTHVNIRMAVLKNEMIPLSTPPLF